MASPGEEDVEYAGQLLSEWVAELSAHDPETRAFAASVLYDVAVGCHLDGKPIPPSLIPPLAGALRDQDPGVRGQAAHALGGVGAAARFAIPLLLDLLADDQEEDKTRALIAGAVAELGWAREAAPILIRLLQSGSAEVKEAAGAALSQADLSGLGVQDKVRACLSDESVLVRTWACWSLWGLEGKAEELIPTLLMALRDERARLDAARLLCSMKGSAVAALPHLLALHDDLNWAVRFQAVRATGSIPCSDEVALPVLHALLNDPHKVVRAAATDWLNARGHR